VDDTKCNVGRSLLSSRFVFVGYNTVFSQRGMYGIDLVATGDQEAVGAGKIQVSVSDQRASALMAVAMVINGINSDNAVSGQMALSPTLIVMGLASCVGAEIPRSLGVGGLALFVGIGLELWVRFGRTPVRRTGAQVPPRCELVTRIGNAGGMFWNDATVC